MNDNEVNKKQVNCTGDAVVGDYIFFERAIFSGSFFNPIYTGTENVQGEIVKDSYGKKTQQHTFTIKLDDGSTTRIKGRNLYKNGCTRLLWEDEDLRKINLAEKHQRGSIAREARSVRKYFAN